VALTGGQWGRQLILPRSNFHVGFTKVALFEHDRNKLELAESGRDGDIT
jgi:hypothetical protein